MAVLGYARVSTLDQDYARQIEALKAASADRIFAEKISGVRADRPQLAKLMKALPPGDIVVVTKIDRLGRSTRELLDIRSARSAHRSRAWVTRCSTQQRRRASCCPRSRRHCRV